MKKYFVLLNKEQGYIFPYLFFIITLLLLFTFHQLMSYQSHSLSYKLELEQYHLESLHYFALDYIQSNKTHNYSEKILSYPIGKIIIIEKNNSDSQLVYDVKTETSDGSMKNYLIKIDSN